MGRGARASRRIKRAEAGEHTAERLMFGLTERLRKARAGIGGGAQGEVDQKIATWEAELVALLLTN